MAITGRRRSCVPYRRSTSPMRPNACLVAICVLVGCVIAVRLQLRAIDEPVPALSAHSGSRGAKMTIDRVGGLIVLVLGLSAAEAPAQERQGAASAAPERRLSLEGGGGVPDPLPRQRANGRRRVCADAQPDTARRRDAVVQCTTASSNASTGTTSERGGTEQFVSGQVRYAFLPRRRVSPYVLGGFGRSAFLHGSVNEFFPDEEGVADPRHLLRWRRAHSGPGTARRVRRYASDHGGRSQVRLFFCSDSRARRRLMAFLRPGTARRSSPQLAGSPRRPVRHQGCQG